MTASFGWEDFFRAGCETTVANARGCALHPSEFYRFHPGRTMSWTVSSPLRPPPSNACTIRVSFCFGKNLKFASVVLKNPPHCCGSRPFRILPTFFTAFLRLSLLRFSEQSILVLFPSRAKHRQCFSGSER